MDLCLFLSFTFFLPPFEDNGLLFWVPDVLCLHSEVVLWHLLSIQMFFDEILGEKVVSLSYSSTILGLPSKLLIIPMRLKGPCRQYCFPSGE